MIQLRAAHAALLSALLPSLGCGRSPSAGAGAGAPLSDASTEAAPPEPPPEPAKPAPLPPLGASSPGEARRSTIATLEQDALLVPHLATLRAHFGAGAHGPFHVQRVDRSDGGSAVLVTRADESDPIVLAVDRDRLVFSRAHPVGGMTPPVRALTIGPGPERGVALFGYVASLHLVAARLWADDGNPFAEIVALTSDACDSLAEAYAPGWGWILACSSSSGTRAQLLREDLTAAWGPEGIVVGTFGPVASATLAFEPPWAWTLTQQAKAVGGDRKLVFRFGADGLAR